MPGPFDEEFTPEEEAALDSENALPPAEDEGEGTVEEAIAASAKSEPAAAEPGAGEPPAGQQPAAQEPPAEDPAAAEERDLAAFLEKHKDKSAEDVLRLAFQQQRRANREAATNRTTRDQVSALANRARAMRERSSQLSGNAEDLKTKFKDRVAADPDGALNDLFDNLLNREISNADVAAQEAAIDEAIVFADTHIPEFGKQWPAMKGLANELGYSDGEIDGISDGRALVTLSLANHSARLIKAGIMDRFGNIVALPQPQPAELDPRLSAPNPQKTLGGAGSGSRGARGTATIEQQLNEINNMSEEQMAAFDRENPGVIDNLLRQAAA